MSVTTGPEVNDVAGCSASLPNNIVRRHFVNETVLMDVNVGRYFRLDATAGEMLEAMLSAPTFGAAAEVLAGRGWGAYDVIVADLVALCHELGELGLALVVPA